MLLRDHPLMCYKGVPNWPPSWTWIDGLENKRLRGEIGILKTVSLSKVLPANRSYLYIAVIPTQAYGNNETENSRTN
jgi:hypothetical protein